MNAPRVTVAPTRKTLIPTICHLDEPGVLFISATTVLEELGMPYLNPLHGITSERDYSPTPDGHLSGAGHLHVGALLSLCVYIKVAIENLTDCELMLTPESWRQLRISTQ